MYSWVVKDSGDITVATGSGTSFDFTPGDDDTYTATLTVTDDEGASVSESPDLITVTNVAPTITLTGAATVDEDATYTLTLGEITDPSTDIVTQILVDERQELRATLVEEFGHGCPVPRSYPCQQ